MWTEEQFTTAVNTKKAPAAKKLTGKKTKQDTDDVEQAPAAKVAKKAPLQKGEYAKMKVAELRGVLAEQGLSSTGLKAELVVRLQEVRDPCRNYRKRDLIPEPSDVRCITHPIYA